MKKRISAFLLSVVLCLGLVGTAFAAETAAVEFTAGEDTLTVSLTGLGKEATYALGGLLVKKQADAKFALAESLDFKTDANGAYTGTFDSLKGLTDGDQICIYLPGVTFTSSDTEDVKDAANGSLTHTFKAEVEEPVILKVTLDPNGGELPEGTKNPIEVEKGKAIGTLPTPTRNSWIFAGWFTAAEGGKYVDKDSTFEADATIFAHWSRKSMGGGSGGGGISSTTSTSVTVKSSAHGKVSVSTSYPKKGDTVTITVTPDDGYQLGTLTVTDRNGNVLELKDLGNGRYSFVMPDSKVTVSAEFVKIEETKETPVTSFTDVPSSFWAYKEISWAAGKGVMQGYGGGLFQPDRTTNRQQLWMVLARLDGANPSDMTAARSWAVNSGISDGTNPTNPMTRQQMVTMLYRYAQMKGYAVTGGKDISGYPDAGSVASYAKDAMAWAVGNGIVQGTSAGTLNPGGTASRAHFAVFLYRFCDLNKIA